MKPAMPPPPHRIRPHRLALGVAALALAGWALHLGLGATEPPPRPGGVPAARAPADATLASPFGAGPAVQALPVASAPLPASVALRPPGAAAKPAALPPPTLDAAERAEARALLAQAGVLDADSARELDGLLYQDALQRYFALRDAGDNGNNGDELRALAAELRAGLPAREAAQDLPAALLAQAQAALRPAAASASPFAGTR